MNRHTLDAKSRKLVFSGPCPDVLQECGAMCCREWDVDLLPSEHASGRYETEFVCKVDNSACNEKTVFCINQQSKLKKHGDGSCVYLNEECACGIYERRPDVCRKFSCSNGWRLASVAPAHKQSETEYAFPRPRDALNPGCMGKVVFIPNPLVMFKTVFYEARKKELVLIVKHISKCTVTSIKRKVDAGHLTDEQIADFFGLFRNQNNTEDIMVRASGLNIDSNVFMELTGLFFSAQLLVPVAEGYT